jgi:hypothetical protein
VHRGKTNKNIIKTMDYDAREGLGCDRLSGALSKPRFALRIHFNTPLRGTRRIAKEKRMINIIKTIDCGVFVRGGELLIA